MEKFNLTQIKQIPRRKEINFNLEPIPCNKKLKIEELQQHIKEHSEQQMQQFEYINITNINLQQNFNIKAIRNSYLEKHLIGKGITEELILDTLRNGQDVTPNIKHRKEGSRYFRLEMTSSPRQAYGVSSRALIIYINILS